MNEPRDPMPPLGRMMAFIDGENLVGRYQAMIKDGRKPYDRVRHKRDVYAWLPGAIWPGLHVILRATYYTYCVGDKDAVASISEELRAFEFQQYYVHGQIATVRLVRTLTPQVFWKPKDRTGKGVDIQMTVDILTNVYQNNLDTVFLLSGDGDYAPLVAECKRMGKQVFVSALSCGLSPALRVSADYFMDLDGQFFEAPVSAECGLTARST